MNIYTKYFILKVSVILAKKSFINIIFFYQMRFGLDKNNCLSKNNHIYFDIFVNEEIYKKM